MAGLQDPEVVDLVAEEANGTALLVIVKEGRWDVDVDVPALRAKMNTYAQFALDGGLYSHYPHLDRRPITIRLDSSTPLPTAITEVLSIAETKLRPYGITLTTAINPQL